MQIEIEFYLMNFILKPSFSMKTRLSTCWRTFCRLYCEWKA